jgi:gluconate 2-dehydrogenase gamma chain
MNETDPAVGSGPRITRRRLVQLALVAFAGTAVGAGSSAVVTRLGSGPRSAYRFFHDDEAELLIEICEQIVPGDDTPGATEAGVIHYIDRQLMGVYQEHQPTYRRGLASFAETCRELEASSFAQLPEESKIAFLRRLESGQVPGTRWSNPSPNQFFGLVVKHTMEGFYGSPRHGGNRGYASYRMLGLDYPQLVGRNRPHSTRT